MSLFVSARADAAASKGAKKASTTRRAKPAAAAAPTRGRSRSSDDDDHHDQTDADPQLMARLKAWRLQEAQRKKAPAFTIFSDRVLLALSSLPPRSLEALAAVPGISKRLVTSQGRSILAVIAADGDVD
jgi:superfamily II DNA helicase RecQ